MNRYKKRGISVIPTKFGIAFTLPFLNQGGALILVYTDGSVLLSHGGTEMGQGLHTKMIQVASRALEIPMERIHISETSTDKVPNTSPTAASSGSDINGMAVLVRTLKLETPKVGLRGACLGSVREDQKAPTTVQSQKSQGQMGGLGTSSLF